MCIRDRHNAYIAIKLKAAKIICEFTQIDIWEIIVPIFVGFIYFAPPNAKKLININAKNNKGKNFDILFSNIIPQYSLAIA